MTTKKNKSDVSAISIPPTGGVGGPTVSITVAEGMPPFLLRIQNVSCRVDLGIPLHLHRIAKACRNIEFNPRRYGALTMRLRDPFNATALLFSSGKLCVTGVRSPNDARVAVQKFAMALGKIGYATNPGELEYKIQNMVGAVDVGFPIRLEGLLYSKHHREHVTYEPELCPGLVYRFSKEKVVCMIFASGKVLITGAKKEGEFSSALTKIYPMLVKFGKTDAVQLAPLPRATPYEAESETKPLANA